MDVTIYWNGTNITTSVISYEREEDICESASFIALVIKGTATYDFKVEDTIILYEESNKKATYKIDAIETNVPAKTISLHGMSSQKNLLDTYVNTTYNVADNPLELTRYWIEKFLTEAGVSYSFNTDDLGEELPEDEVFGNDLISSIINKLLQYSGWYLYYDEDGAAVIGTLDFDSDTYDFTFYDQDVLEMRTLKEDSTLRNRVVVWGKGLLPDGWVFADVSVQTPWNYDSNDKRTVLISNHYIGNNNSAKNIAGKALKEFSKLNEVIIVTIAGAPNVKLGNVVRLWTNYIWGIFLVNGISVVMSSSGLITTLTMNKRCPRLLGAITYNGYVYVGTDGGGVWRRRLSGGSWEDFSTGLPSLYVSKLKIRNGVFACVTTDGSLSYRYVGDISWVKFNSYPVVGAEYVGCAIEPRNNNIVACVNTLDAITITDGLHMVSSGARSWIVDFSGTNYYFNELVASGCTYLGSLDIDSNDYGTYITVMGEGEPVQPPILGMLNTNDPLGCSTVTHEISTVSPSYKTFDFDTLNIATGGVLSYGDYIYITGTYNFPVKRLNLLDDTISSLNPGPGDLASGDIALDTDGNVYACKDVTNYEIVQIGTDFSSYTSLYDSGLSSTGHLYHKIFYCNGYIVVIVYDDSPGTYIHWIIWNIETQTGSTGSKEVYVEDNQIFEGLTSTVIDTEIGILAVAWGLERHLTGFIINPETNTSTDMATPVSIYGGYNFFDSMGETENGYFYIQNYTGSPDYFNAIIKLTNSGISEYWIEDSDTTRYCLYPVFTRYDGVVYANVTDGWHNTIGLQLLRMSNLSLGLNYISYSDLGNTQAWRCSTAIDENGDHWFSTSANWLYHIWRWDVNTGVFYEISGIPDLSAPTDFRTYQTGNNCVILGRLDSNNHYVAIVLPNGGEPAGSVTRYPVLRYASGVIEDLGEWNGEDDHIDCSQTYPVAVMYGGFTAPETNYGTLEYWPDNDDGIEVNLIYSGVSGLTGDQMVTDARSFSQNTDQGFFRRTMFASDMMDGDYGYIRILDYDFGLVDPVQFEVNGYDTKNNIEEFKFSGIVEHLETTNGFETDEPFIFATVLEGANEKFYQRNPYDLGDDPTTFMDRTSGLPSEMITVIRVDDSI